VSYPSTVILSTLALVLAARVVDAGLTSDSCLALKRQAWGNLRKCESTEQAKAIKGKPADLAKCSTKFQEKLAKITAKATKDTIACRYRDNGDGTVIDYDLGLQWEKKNSAPPGTQNPHYVESQYYWGISTEPNGPAFTDFLNRLNNCSFAPGFFSPIPFAGFCDWRLPTLAELQSILLAPNPCGTSPCIDPIFGPTNTNFPYWSSTTNTGTPGQAWAVSFNIGSSVSSIKSTFLNVRAVRRAL
jgi:hypothetical protein